MRNEQTLDVFWMTSATCVSSLFAGSGNGRSWDRWRNVFFDCNVICTPILNHKNLDRVGQLCSSCRPTPLDSGRRIEDGTYCARYAKRMGSVPWGSRSDRRAWVCRCFWNCDSAKQVGILDFLSETSFQNLSWFSLPGSGHPDVIRLCLSSQTFDCKLRTHLYFRCQCHFGP